MNRLQSVKNIVHEQTYNSMDKIQFKVNGVLCEVGCEVSSHVMLVDYLRDTLELRGTKFMCREGGCGACIVAVTKCAGGPVLAINSCMTPITSCKDWEITTIEKIGNKKKGYHILQKTLADYNGTQCGYCSPAWIMNMYSFLQRGVKPTMLEIEKAFGGNVCRCTGYRPILDAFKKFAKDAVKEDRIVDIEDLSICKKTGIVCNKTCNDDDDWCILDKDEVKSSEIIHIQLKDGKYWFKVCDLRSIFNILDKRGYESYMLVFGNTARGAYPIDDYPNTIVDISTIQELKITEFDQNLIVGAGLTLTELRDICQSASKEEYFEYLSKFVEHLDLVAHIPVRNAGSIGGNLMIKHQHNEFASDIFLLFTTVGAYLTLMSPNGLCKNVSMADFLKEDMKGKIIVKAMLPPLGKNCKFFSMKVMPRIENAHAIVNCGFLYQLDPSNKVQNARIVYGGLSPSFTRARATEVYLKGKSLFTDQVLQATLQVLENELIVVDLPPAPSVNYRKKLALALFYKGLLALCPNSLLNSKYASGGSKIHLARPISQGKQIFNTNPSLWPLNQPIPKVEALIQCSGEAKYTDDNPTQPHEVHAAFAVSTVGVGDIIKIDASKALAVPGVIDFYTASDIPGTNSFTPNGTVFYVDNEEVFCSGSVKYYNQPIGLVVAETQAIADAAAKLVTATYKNVKTPVIDIKEAIKDSNRLNLFTSSDASETGTDVAKVIKGQNTIYGQYHFAMENLSCLTIPTEEGLEVHVTSQWMDGVQMCISRALNIQENHIDVHIRRLGGAYGIKISRSILVAVASSLVTQKLNRPCRIMLTLPATTRMFGKRLPFHNNFECSVNQQGVIQKVDYNVYTDNGHVKSETLTVLGTDVYYNCYNNARWNYKCYDVVTDTAKNTWCRAPGTLENISMAEYLLEQISYEMSLDPIEVRLANLDTTKYNDLRQMVEDIKISASYNERRAAVDLFNSQNRWRKRGLRTSFLRWTPVGATVFEVNLAIYHDDGTVVITHGGIEMGQGINTKAVQICAYYFKIPIDQIQIKSNNNIIAPNCFITGGSLGSQNIGLGVRRCCEEMLRRLEPIRNQMTNPTWKELITNAFNSNVDLQVHGYVGNNDVFMYNIFGVAIAEVEIDVLTGESEKIRVDILQDVGQSVSPEVDVGQVEGAFIMGLGYWTSESLVYDKKSGELLTDRTWDYYVPLARDIPQDFRVYFRKNSYSLEQILGAKGTGEPPMCLSIVIAFALREAIAAARKDAGDTAWFPLDGPTTVEQVHLATLACKEHYSFNK